MKNEKLKMKNNPGFTLIEMIIYLAIVSTLLVSISYLMIDILNGQTKSLAGGEVNQNIRFISNRLIQDITSAQSITSISPSNLVLAIPGNTITYAFNVSNSTLTRAVGAAVPIKLYTDPVLVTGSFTDLSATTRSKNIGVALTVEYKNPSNLEAYVASSTVQFAVELRGRR